MSLDISARGRAMPASPIRKLTPLADDAKRRGVKVYHLNIGQPDIETPEVMRRRLKDAPSVLAYTPSGGTHEFVKALLGYYESLGISLDAGQLVATTGGSEAIQFAMLACDFGNQMGCNNLAALKLNGTGMKKDPAGARDLLRRSCETGAARSCFSYGLVLAKGQGGKADKKKAIEVFKQACGMGLDMACTAERQLDRHELLRVGHGGQDTEEPAAQPKLAPSSAVAHTQSRSAGSAGITANSNPRSFSLFSVKTRTTSSFVTGGTPSTPTS